MSTYLLYAARGLTAWWRYFATVLTAAVLCLLISFVAALAVRAARAGPMLNALSPGHHPVAYLAAAGISFAILLVSVIVAARLVQHKTFADIIGAWSWRAVGLGVVVWSVALAAGTLIDFTLAPHGFALSPKGVTVSFALAAVVALAIQTFTEEFIFRGYVTQGLLLATRRPSLAALGSGLAFGLLHIPNGIPQAVAATALGIVASLIAIRTGSIAFTYGLHFVNNLFGALIVVSSDDVFAGLPALIVQRTPQLLALDVAVEIVALGIVGALVLRFVEEQTAPQSLVPVAITS